jgi:hypothetical protein
MTISAEHKRLMNSLAQLLKQEVDWNTEESVYTVGRDAASHLTCTLGSLRELDNRSFYVALLGSRPPTLPELMDATLTSYQRMLLRVATLPSRTAFLQQQPPLYKLAARVVKQWAHQGGPAYLK